MQRSLEFAQAAGVGAGPLAGFHPAVASWFQGRFKSPTEVQAKAWALTTLHRDALITAPTGSGKTLAAFLSATWKMSSRWSLVFGHNWDKTVLT